MSGPPRKGRRDRRPRRPRRNDTSGVAAAEPLRPTDEAPEIETFSHWDLGDDLQGAIRAMGIEKPTPIQALAIGPVLGGADVIAKAETGTGKTLAFGAPMIARMDAQRASVLALVLCPTRELSEQVHGVLAQLGEAKGLNVALIVGGEEMKPQVDALQGGAQVVVGTPGRVLDLMNQRFLSFPWTEFAVLDEADKMLEIGFIDDVRKILKAIPEERQTLLFSATFPPSLLSLARESTRDPVEVATARGVSTVDTIDQYYIPVDEDRRAGVLARLIKASDPDDVFLVFCERRTDVDRLLRRMERERFPVKALHGGYDQASRFRVMTAFREREVKALLATDVASRGLDVQHVTHVVNFGVPRDVSDYTHRIGRTGRAGREGTAITFVTPTDRRNWTALKRGTPFEIAELPDEFFRRGSDRSRPRRDESDEPRRQRDAEQDSGRGRGRGRGDEPRRGRDADRDDKERSRDEERGRRRDAERSRGRGADRDRDDRGRRRRSERATERERDRDEERGRRRDSETSSKRGRDRDEGRQRSERERDESRQRPGRERDESRQRPGRERDESRQRPERDRDESRRRPERERPREHDRDRDRDRDSGRREERGRDRGARERDDRGRDRDRGRGRGERDREERPEREAHDSKARPAAKAPREDGPGFGAGIAPEAPVSKKPRRPKRASKAPEKESEPARPEPPGDSGSGFGAGL